MNKPRRLRAIVEIEFEAFAVDYESEDEFGRMQIPADVYNLILAAQADLQANTHHAAWLVTKYGDEGLTVTVKPPRAHLTVGDHEDFVTCTCGNEPTGDGFYTCTRDGMSLVDDGGMPLAGMPAAYYQYIRCEQCGAVYDTSEILKSGANSTVEAFSNGAA